MAKKKYLNTNDFGVMIPSPDPKNPGLAFMSNPATTFDLEKPLDLNKPEYAGIADITPAEPTK